MPMDRSLYPRDWKTISARIRERAHNKCEVCGLENGAVILRSIEDAERYLVYVPETGGVAWPSGEWIRASEVPEEYDANEKFTTVVLTVGHLDHDPQNNADENLLCMCQRCHLKHDGKHHARNAAETRRKKKEQATGQLTMF